MATSARSSNRGPDLLRRRRLEGASRLSKGLCLAVRAETLWGMRVIPAGDWTGRRDACQSSSFSNCSPLSYYVGAAETLHARRTFPRPAGIRLAQIVRRHLRRGGVQALYRGE